MSSAASGEADESVVGVDPRRFSADRSRVGHDIRCNGVVERTGFRSGAFRFSYVDCIKTEGFSGIGKRGPGGASGGSRRAKRAVRSEIEGSGAVGPRFWGAGALRRHTSAEPPSGGADRRTSCWLRSHRSFRWRPAEPVRGLGDDDEGEPEDRARGLVGAPLLSRFLEPPAGFGPLGRGHDLGAGLLELVTAGVGVEGGGTWSSRRRRNSFTDRRRIFDFGLPEASASRKSP
jgi:hypothetical protein